MFEELDFQATRLGELSLRRRTEPRLNDQVVYEVKLGDDFLMSSLFTEAEAELARLALAELDGADLDIVVGGLGLGHTAAAVLASRSVRSLTVIELLPAVIDWHRDGLVPLGETLVSDPRTTLICADFFAALGDTGGFGGFCESGQVHGVLLDIDHSPTHWLDPDNGPFYSIAGLRRLATRIRAGGVFGLWSNDPPDQRFTSLLTSVFGSGRSQVVDFANPYTGGRSSNTIYLARQATTVD